MLLFSLSKYVVDRILPKSSLVYANFCNHRGPQQLLFARVGYFRCYCCHGICHTIIASSLAPRLILLKRCCLATAAARRPPPKYPEKESIARERARDVVFYCMGFCVLIFGVCFAAVPLYRRFCSSATRFGNDANRPPDPKYISIGGMQKVGHRPIRVHFVSTVHGDLGWTFKPEQRFVQVYPGETALAFFRATNQQKERVVGISTYNVLPYEAGAYFNKIQCFCFEEQTLEPGESVDMPVFFYVDPDFADDPLLENVHELVLTYTFFQSKQGLKLPTPSVPELKEMLRGMQALQQEQQQKQLEQI